MGGYFGLSDVGLLTSGDESFMVVIGERSAGAERCLTVVDSDISVDSCLNSLASLDGREVFRFQNQRLMHVASGLCVAAAGDDTYQAALRDCGSSSESQMVRSVWELTANAQLKLPRMGDSCLALRGGRASAKLLLASAARQRAALNKLRALTPILESCRFVSLAVNITGNRNPRQYNFKLSKEVDSSLLHTAGMNSEMAVLGGVYASLGVSTNEILKLISDSSNALAEMRAKFLSSA